MFFREQSFASMPLNMILYLVHNSARKYAAVVRLLAQSLRAL